MTSSRPAGSRTSPMMMMMMMSYISNFLSIASYLFVMRREEEDQAQGDEATLIEVMLKAIVA